jgi:hypothetical protein
LQQQLGVDAGSSPGYYGPLTIATIQAEIDVLTPSVTPNPDQLGMILIEQFEGFSSTAYFDVNSYRVGYGDDLYATSNGSGGWNYDLNVTQSTTTSMAAAAAELQHRLDTSLNGGIPGIERDLGTSKFLTLSPLRQGVLEDIAWNYGSFESPALSTIVSDFNNDSSIDQIANDIQALTADPSRRADEANLFRWNPTSDGSTGVTFTISPIIQTVAKGGVLEFQITINNPDFTAQPDGYLIYYQTNNTAQSAAVEGVDYDGYPDQTALTFTSSTLRYYILDISTINNPQFGSNPKYVEVDLYNNLHQYLNGAGDTATIVGTIFPCFVTASRIQTIGGFRAIETLAVGDEVRTLLGGPGRIVWIGARTVDCRRHTRPETVWPVRIVRAAFGPNVPERDLYLSPNHAVYVKDVLVPIKHLINGASIAQVPMNKVTYYHVELAQHDVLLAEGLPAESYLDTGDRPNFGNHDGVMRLFPDFSSRRLDTARLWEAYGCAPLIVTGPELDAVRAWVDAIAAVMTQTASAA